MNPKPRLAGLIAATYTPMYEDGAVNVDQIPALCTFLRDQQGVDGLYVCGSTGEGISLRESERREVAAAFASAANGKYPVVVQVGHNSLREARDLASHAVTIGASAISANAPSYFKVNDVDTLVQCMREIAEGAPELPFYYYHIPHLTGAQVDMVDFLSRAREEIPSFSGIKFTAPTLHEYRACLLEAGDQLDILWGSDEMLLPALAMGAQGAVGSTYNVAGRRYQKIVAAFSNGHVAAAQAEQDRCNAMIRAVYQYPFHSAMKLILRRLGIDCGQCRLPQQQLSSDVEAQLQRDLEKIDFYSWNS